VVSAPRGAAPSSRRALLKLAAAALSGGAATGLAGCGNQRRARRARYHASPEELRVLNRLLAVELEAIQAYEAGIPLLQPHFAATARQFLQAEILHAGELQQLIKRGGGRPTTRAARSYRRPPGSREAALELLRSLERLQVDGYLHAIPTISRDRTRAVLGAILGSDAQHLALLRAQLGEPALAGAFVGGST